jgi:hypothetical protein
VLDDLLLGGGELGFRPAALAGGGVRRGAPGELSIAVVIVAVTTIVGTVSSSCIGRRPSVPRRV